MLKLNDLEEVMTSANRTGLLLVPAGTTIELDPARVPSLDLNRSLSEQLIIVPKQERAKVIGQTVSELVNGVTGEALLITGLEILFDRSLAVDPIRLLKRCSANKMLLVVWPGEKSSSGLSYATPSHPEYRTYKASGLRDVVFITADAQLHRGL